MSLLGRIAVLGRFVCAPSICFVSFRFPLSNAAYRGFRNLSLVLHIERSPQSIPVPYALNHKSTLSQDPYTLQIAVNVSKTAAIGKGHMRPVDIASLSAKPIWSKGLDWTSIFKP